MIVLFALSVFVMQADDALDSRYRAVERLLQSEEDPRVRVELVMKWFELRRLTMKPEEEIEVFGRLLSEEAQLRDRAGEGINRIQRLLAWHFFDKKNFVEAIKQFERLKVPTAKDRLAYGDSLLQQGLAVLALEQYRMALNELEAPASYRMGWAYLQFEDFENSLKFFDRSLAANPIEGMDIRAVAFKERIVPWIYQQSADEMSDSELQLLESQAQKAFGENFEAELKVMLEKMIQAYLARDFLKSAKKVQLALNLRSGSKPEFAFQSSALWIRTYRSRMLHDELKEVLSALPEEAVENDSNSEILDEISKTIEAYEKILVADKMNLKAKEVLSLTYRKAFNLFPEARVFDKARINDSKMHYDQGDYQYCLMRTNFASSEAGIENERRILRSRCELKSLENLASKAEVQEVAARLLVKERIYEAFPEAERHSVRDQLARLFLSTLSSVPENALANSALSELKAQSLWTASEPLQIEVDRAYEGLRFNDLVSKSNSEDGNAAESFVSLASEAKTAEVSIKALSNAALLDQGVYRIKACYGLLERKKSHPIDADVNRSCIVAFQESLELKALYDWMRDSKDLSSEDQILLGLVEVALGDSKGEDRLRQLKQDRLVALLQSPINQEQTLKGAETEKRFQDTVSPSDLKNPASAMLSKIKKVEAADRKIQSALKAAKSKDERVRWAKERHVLVESFTAWLGQLKKSAVVSKRDRTEFEQSLSSLQELWSAQANDRKEVWCRLAMESKPFEDFKGEGCDELKFAHLAKESQIFAKEKSAPSQLSTVDHEKLAKIRAQTDEKKKNFLRAWTLLTSSSSDLSAVTLLEWAVESKRSDILEYALSLSPRSEYFYLHEAGASLNAYYRELFATRANALKNEAQAATSL